MRVAMFAAVVTVAGVAAWTSYRHTVAMVAAHGEDVATARLIPVTTDGLILAAGLVLLHCARSHRRAPGLARWLLGLGVMATLAANVDHGAGHGVIGAVVAAWPATAFVGVSELALWLIRASGPARPHDAPRTVSAAPLAGPDWLPDVLPPRPGPVQTVT
ncbi:MAG TPA: DUF2637 domain-containing protein, partial [Mycobacteriales bacterium]|nr:DUF2637 domain-containing protein [Mycobacteriales bacterium]